MPRITPARFLAVLGIAASSLMLAPVPQASASAPAQPASRASSGKEIDLRPRFKEGEELRYVMTLENDGLTEIAGLDSSKQKSWQQIEFRMKTIASDPQTGSTVELIYDTLRVTLDAGETKLQYDSTKKNVAPAKSAKPGGRNTSRPSSAKPGSKAKGDPVEDLLSQDEADPSESFLNALESVVGSKLTLKVAPDGSITSVEGGEGLSSALVSKYAGPITDPQGVKDLFGPIFSVRAAKTTARVGESWQHVDRMDLSMLGALRLVTDHQLKSASGDRATVDFKGKIEMDSEGAAPMQSFKLTDTRYEGSYIWNTGIGALETMQQVQEFSLSGGTADAAIKLRNNGKVKIERRR